MGTYENKFNEYMITNLYEHMRINSNEYIRINSMSTSILMETTFLDTVHRVQIVFAVQGME